jgi:hypothetical protein
MRILNLMSLMNKKKKDYQHSIDIYKTIFLKEWDPFIMKRMKT